MRTEARGPRLPMDAENLPLLAPKLGPDFESPTQKPRPRDLRREKRDGIGTALRFGAFRGPQRWNGSADQARHRSWRVPHARDHDRAPLGQGSAGSGADTGKRF